MVIPYISYQQNSYQQNENLKVARLSDRFLNARPKTTKFCKVDSRLWEINIERSYLIRVVLFCTNRACTI
nr:hypothetical protein NALGGIOA_00112 [Oryctes rhinoceros nudivirus]